MKVLLLLFSLTILYQPEPPDLDIWFECVYRSTVYPNRAYAAISYRYSGSEAIQAEDSRWFGDTETGNTIVQPFDVYPGEHLKAFKVNVGALKVVTWKVVLFGELHVVTVWDNPEFLDCTDPPKLPTETPVNL